MSKNLLTCADFKEYVYNTPFFVNVPLYIAKYKACPLTIGKGLLVNSDSLEIQEFLENWMESQNMFIKLWKNQQWQSVIGRSLMYVLPTYDGGLTLRVATWNIMNRVSKIDEEEQIAVIYDNPYLSDLQTYQKITFVPGKVTIETFQKQETRIETATAELTPDKKVKPDEVYETGVNFLPFVEFTNMPFQTFFANTSFNFQPDWLEARKLIDDLQQSIAVKRKERLLNRTRFNLQYDMKTLEKAQEMGIDGAFREIIEADGLLNSVTNVYAEGMQGNELAILQGDPKLTEYNQDILNTFKFILSVCGYNLSSYETSQYKNKTESLMQSEMDAQTTKVKQQYLLTKLYKLFNFVLQHYGLWKEEYSKKKPYTLQFVSLQQVDRIKLVEELKQRLEMQIVSRSQAMSEIENIPISEAQRKLVDIDKDIQERNEMELKAMLDSEPPDMGDKELDKDVL